MREGVQDGKKTPEKPKERERPGRTLESQQEERLQRHTEGVDARAVVVEHLALVGVRSDRKEVIVERKKRSKREQHPGRKWKKNRRRGAPLHTRESYPAKRPSPAPSATAAPAPLALPTTPPQPLGGTRPAHDQHTACSSLLSLPLSLSLSLSL